MAYFALKAFDVFCKPEWSCTFVVTDFFFTDRKSLPRSADFIAFGQTTGFIAKHHHCHAKFHQSSRREPTICQAAEVGDNKGES